MVVGWGWGEGISTCKGFSKNSNCSSSQLLAKDTPLRPPPTAVLTAPWVGSVRVPGEVGCPNTIYIVIIGVGGEGPGGGRQLRRSFVLTLLWENGLYLLEGGVWYGSRWLPPVSSVCPDGCPTPISVLCLGYGEPPHGTGGAQA